MTVRIAAASSLVMFAVALIAGLVADNTFVTTVSRALFAMGGTFGVGLIVGAMANAVAEENARAKAAALEKLENSEAKAAQTTDKRKWAGGARSLDATGSLSRVSERRR